MNWTFNRGEVNPRKLTNSLWLQSYLIKQIMKLTLCSSIPSSLQVYLRLDIKIPENTRNVHKHISFIPNSLISTVVPHLSTYPWHCYKYLVSYGRGKNCPLMDDPTCLLALGRGHQLHNIITISGAALGKNLDGILSRILHLNLRIVTTFLSIFFYIGQI